MHAYMHCPIPYTCMHMHCLTPYTCMHTCTVLYLIHACILIHALSYTLYMHAHALSYTLYMHAYRHCPIPYTCMHMHCSTSCRYSGIKHLKVVTLNDKFGFSVPCTSNSLEELILRYKEISLEQHNPGLTTTLKYPVYGPPPS